MWEVVSLDSRGRYRYSYWSKKRVPDELGAYSKAQAMIDAGEIEGGYLTPMFK